MLKLLKNNINEIKKRAIEFMHIKKRDPVEPKKVEQKITTKKELAEIEKSNQIKKLYEKNKDILISK